VRDEYSPRIEALEAEYSALEDRRQALWEEMTDSLLRRAPDISYVQWPTPADGDDDPDPLYDSSRDYVEQMDRYKRHQDKPTARKKRGKAAA
jgi:hypothetical protein